MKDLKIGDLVILKSGSIVMTVTSDIDIRNYVTVTWFDNSSNSIKSEALPSDSLELAKFVSLNQINK